MVNRDKAQEQTIIAAVSGGVDSVVMLHQLADNKQRLIVAHYDHGIRDDSAADARFVEGLAEKYNLKFELGEGRLGKNTSEEKARLARHDFLRMVSQKYDSALIATAHHHDDVIETAIINILRGTGRRGMSSLRENNKYLRPLLRWSKSKIYDYALQHKLEWVEDETNLSDKYLRNRIRHRLIPLLKQKSTLAQFEKLVDWFYVNNPVMDKLVDDVLAEFVEDTKVHTALSIELLSDRIVGGELLAAILNRLGAEIDRTEIYRLLDFAMKGRDGTIFNQFPPVNITKKANWLMFEN